MPVDEPAVAAARADNLSALAATHGVAHAIAPAVPAVAHVAPVVATEDNEIVKHIIMMFTYRR